MRFILFIVSFILIQGLAHAQKLSMDDLMEVPDLSQAKIDTLMKKRNYMLRQVEADSSSNMKYYTSLERNEKEPTWVRSLSYIDVETTRYKGRMVTYRTFSKQEYNEQLVWLLQHNYRVVNKYAFSTEQHTQYSNGKLTILVKVKTFPLKGNKVRRSYELEFGK